MTAFGVSRLAGEFCQAEHTFLSNKFIYRLHSYSVMVFETALQARRLCV